MPSFITEPLVFVKLSPYPDVKLVRLMKLATRSRTLMRVSANLSFRRLRLLFAILNMGTVMLSNEMSLPEDDLFSNLGKISAIMFTVIRDIAEIFTSSIELAT